MPPAMPDEQIANVCIFSSWEICLVARLNHMQVIVDLSMFSFSIWIQLRCLESPRSLSAPIWPWGGRNRCRHTGLSYSRLLLREQAENECFQEEIWNKKQGGTASIIVARSVKQQNAKCASLFQISAAYWMSSTPEKAFWWWQSADMFCN